MPWEAWITLGVVSLVLVALARNLAPPDVVLLSGAVTLTTFSALSPRFPSPPQLADAFGNEGLVTIAALFVVAAGLTETGALSLLTDRLLGRPRSVPEAQLRLMAPVAAVSAFLNNTPVVSMFMPVVHEWCKRTSLRPSKLFIPLSYAAVLGGCCTLIGTSTNLVVHGLMVAARQTDPTMPLMNMFTLGAIGVPATIVGFAYILVASPRLLPDREPAHVAMGNPREYTVEMLLRHGSTIAGVTIEEAGLRHLPGTYLAAIEREGETIVAVGPEERLFGGDRLVFVGTVESIVDLQRVRGLTPATDQVFKLDGPRHRRFLVEAVVSDTCPIVGMTVRDGRFRSRYEAAVIAVHRNGERVGGKIGDIVLRPGDTLLLEANPRFLKYHRNNRDFFLVSAVADSQPRRHEGAGFALAVLVGMVLVSSLETYTGISLLNASLIAAGLMLLLQSCSVEQARRSIDWPILLAIGSALAIGRAIETTGLATFAASALIDLARDAGAWGVLGGVYLVTLVMTELVTNNAAAALAFPLAVATAAELNVEFMPFAIAIAIAASAGFATPLGYQTHLMVYGPGGYRFSDFVRFGLPLDILVMIITVGLAPLLFPF